MICCGVNSTAGCVTSDARDSEEGSSSRDTTARVEAAWERSASVGRLNTDRISSSAIAVDGLLLEPENKRLRPTACGDGDGLRLSFEDKSQPSNVALEAGTEGALRRD